MTADAAAGRRPGRPTSRVRTACALLLVAFAAHNLEEFVQSRDWTPPGPLGETDLYAPPALAVAMVLLTLGAAALLAPACRAGAGRVAVGLAALVAGALLLNATGHVLGALVDLSYGPGLVTAALLVAPAAALLLTRLRSTGAWSIRGLAGWALAGALASVPLIVLALLLAQPLTGRTPL